MQKTLTFLVGRRKKPTQQVLDTFKYHNTDHSNATERMKDRGCFCMLGHVNQSIHSDM